MTSGRPKIIEDYWYSIDWDVGEIWSLELPAHEMPLEPLAWHLDVPVWPDERRHAYSVSPRQVLENPSERPTEMRRMEEASLDYPLDIHEHLGRIMILDGFHRLAKAHSLGFDTILVRRVPESGVRSIGH